MVLLQKYIYILIMLLNVFLSVDFYKSYVRLETDSDIQSDLYPVSTPESKRESISDASVVLMMNGRSQY